MSKVESITLWRKSEDGEDEYGDPVGRWEPSTVDGCLVYELAGSDLHDADMPDGIQVTARVQMPDSFMAAAGRDAPRGCKVALTDRGQTFDDAYWVVGSPNYAPDLPTGWNTTITLGRKDG